METITDKKKEKKKVDKEALEACKKAKEKALKTNATIRKDEDSN